MRSNQRLTKQRRLPLEGSVLDQIDHVSSNAKQSCRTALLTDFEDDEAVIQMIIPRRNPTMRHVSHTHCVTLDWLSDWNILVQMIQVRYVDTQSQLADILPKDHLLVTDGSDVSDCSMSWMFVFPPAAIFVIELTKSTSLQSAQRTTRRVFVCSVICA